MTARTRRQLVAAVLVAALVGVALSDFSDAAFTSSTSTGASTVTAGDWTPPLAALTDPGDTVTGVVELWATASDGESAVRVGIEVSAGGQSEWTQLCAPTPPPLGCDWDTTLASDGSYDLRAVATDAFGNTGEDLVTGIIVDNAP